MLPKATLVLLVQKSCDSRQFNEVFKLIGWLLILMSERLSYHSTSSPLFPICGVELAALLIVCWNHTTGRKPIKPLLQDDSKPSPYGVSNNVTILTQKLASKKGIHTLLVLMLLLCFQVQLKMPTIVLCYLEQDKGTIASMIFQIV